jgi:hypothetical protein
LAAKLPLHRGLFKCLAANWQKNVCRGSRQQPSSDYDSDVRRDADWEGCWAILWRSFVFLPYMLAAFIALLVVSLGRWVLPIRAAFYAYSREWLLVTISAGVWLVAVVAYRRRRLGRCFEAPPSLL